MDGGRAGNGRGVLATSRAPHNGYAEFELSGGWGRSEANAPEATVIWNVEDCAPATRCSMRPWSAAAEFGYNAVAL
jgi:hypothetical protein